MPERERGGCTHSRVNSRAEAGGITAEVEHRSVPGHPVSIQVDVIGKSLAANPDWIVQCEAEEGHDIAFLVHWEWSPGSWISYPYQLSALLEVAVNHLVREEQVGAIVSPIINPAALQIRAKQFEAFDPYRLPALRLGVNKNFRNIKDEVPFGEARTWEDSLFLEWHRKSVKNFQSWNLAEVGRATMDDGPPGQIILLQKYPRLPRPQLAYSAPRLILELVSKRNCPARLFCVVRKPTRNSSASQPSDQKSFPSTFAAWKHWDNNINAGPYFRRNEESLRSTEHPLVEQPMLAWTNHQLSTQEWESRW